MFYLKRIGIIIILVIVGGFVATLRPVHKEAPVPVPSTVSDDETTVVKNLVTAFGQKLKMVSLLASTTARTAAMNEAYGEYVAPELLAKWYPEGSEALGRYTSSPWPDSIDVVEIRKEGEYFVVIGNVIEVSSDGVPVATYSVALGLQKRGDVWKIMKVEKGPYVEKI